MKSVALLIAAAGCATKLQIVGPYANQLSHSDVQQINSLIMISELNRHLYTRLEAVRPDKVLIKYVGYNRSLDGTYTSDVAPNPLQLSNATVGGVSWAKLVSKVELPCIESTYESAAVV